MHLWGRMLTSSMILRHGDFAVLVTCADPSHVEWLVEFLCPPFTADRTGGSRGGSGERDRASPSLCDVWVETDERRYSDLLGLEPSGRHATAFVLQTRTVELPERADRSGARWLHDEERGCFYGASPETERFTILSSRNDARLRSPMLRVVRELAMNHARSAGHLLLHASSFTLGDDAVALLGPKGSGKTTLLTLALTRPGTRYLTNDRLEVVRRGGLTSFSVPTIVNVRRNMLRFFPELEARLRDGGYHFRRTLEECRKRVDPPSRPGASGDPIGVTPAQYRRLMGTDAASSAPPARLLFPRLTHRPGGFAVRRMSALEAAARVDDALFAAAQGRRARPFFVLRGSGPGPNRSRLEGQWRDLASAVPSFEVEAGLDAYAAPDAVETFIESLLKS